MQSACRLQLLVQRLALVRSPSYKAHSPMVMCLLKKGCSGDQGIWRYEGHPSQTKGNSVKLTRSGHRAAEPRQLIQSTYLPPSQSEMRVGISHFSLLPWPSTLALIFFSDTDPQQQVTTPCLGYRTDAYRWNPVKTPHHTRWPPTWTE